MTDRRSLIVSIHRMTHQLAIALERGELGVDQPEAHVLSHLAEHGEATVTEIHRTFGHKRSTLTSVLDRLEAKQLIERVVNAADRRSFIIKLTPNGRIVARRVQSWMRKLESDIERNLTEEQMESLDAVGRSISKLLAVLNTPA
jgi:DNA-binding MarR family transcriptional regulator